MALTVWQKEFRNSREFADTADRLKAELKLEGSAYRFSSRPLFPYHTDCVIEESYGTHYCCHTHKVLGVRY